MEIVTKIKVYETDKKEEKGLDEPILQVKSHWNYNDRVLLELSQGFSITVLKDDLERAIQNAVNKRSW